jgi:hypothetical protein
MRKTRTAFFLSLVALFCGGASQALAAGDPLQPQGMLPGANAAYFGYSMAIDGDTALVGAIADNAGNGAAYVFVRTGSAWSLQQELTAQDGANGDEFGYAVALSGNTAMIGATARSNGDGAVYAFTRSGAAWRQQSELQGSVGTQDDFSCSIALSGTTAVIGADNAQGGVGAAFVYASSGATWSQQAAFTGLSAGDYFGFSVGLSPAGNTAVVGAFGVAGNTGEAYVFASSGTTWSQSQSITASGGQTGDRFGYSVAAGSGTILIGAYAAGGPGAAYIFNGSGATWSQAQKLVPPDPTGGDYFGASVALSGNTAIIGAYEHSSNTPTPGAAYLFANGASAWSQTQELLAPGGGAYFGYSVAVSATTVAIGAIGASNDSGAAYLFAPGSTVAAPALGKGAGVPALMLLLAALGSLAIRPRRGVLS